MDLPPSFRRNIHDAFGEPGQRWLETLPRRIASCAERWNLTVGEPFLLSFSYCAAATRADGSPAVLKIAFPGDDIIGQIHALRAFNGRGMVRLLEDDIEQGEVLLERLLPGRMLVELVSPDRRAPTDPAADEAATRIAAGVMRRVWQPAPAPPHPFATLDRWIDELLLLPQTFTGHPCPLPAAFFERAAALWRDLAADRRPLFLTAGDVHHFNILSVTEPEVPGSLDWRAIDPFGVVAEPEFEPAAFLLNPYLDLPLTPAIEAMQRRRISVFAEEFGSDPRRVAAFAAIYAAISSGWTLGSGSDGWQHAAHMAEVFAGWAGA